MADLHLLVFSSNQAYSRKQKSLGLLCSNFLTIYDRDDVHSISLDDAAYKLGVERRRIYDIVNVLESVGILCRKAKNQYSWKGFSGVPEALRQLKEGSLKGNSSAVDANYESRLIDYEDDTDSDLTSVSHKSMHVMSKSSASGGRDNRREKSLTLLTQNFIKLFVCSNVHLISLDEAAKSLLGDKHSAPKMRTKIRRLYDIANVLAAIRLIEKTRNDATRKPAFRWLGSRGKVNNNSKRAFGTDVTNTDSKRSRLANSFDLNKSPNSQIQKHAILEGSIVEDDGNKLEHDHNSLSIKFGPFSPFVKQETGTSKNESKWGLNRGRLTSIYHPPYQNQALRELFSHYKEAWQLWHSESSNKSSLQIPEP